MTCFELKYCEFIIVGWTLIYRNFDGQVIGEV